MQPRFIYVLYKPFSFKFFLHLLKISQDQNTLMKIEGFY